MVLEKGLDRKGLAVLAQADVKKFYDRLSILRICLFLECQGVPLAILGGLLRLHFCIQIIVNFEGGFVRIINRTRGVMTGSRSAVLVGRIPVYDIIGRNLQNWIPKGFPLDDGKALTVASWVDNIYAVSSFAHSAIEMLNDFEGDLSQYWGLVFGEDCKKVMKALGHPEDDEEHEGFKECSTFPCMGHLLDKDSGITSCFKNTATSMWRAFHSNAGALELRGKPVSQVRVFHRTVSPVFTYRCSRWPWAITAARKVNRTQTLMFGRMMNLKREPGQTVSDFCTQRDLKAGKLAEKTGKLSKIWADRVLRWSDHLMRPRNGSSWAAQAFQIQQSDWLRAQRLPFVCNSRNLSAGGTGTRALALAPRLRYEDCLDAALAHLQ